MKTSRHENLARRKRRIARRLRPRTWKAQPTPMYRARNIQYEHGDWVRGLASGGIGAMHRLALHTGLVAALDAHVEVLKKHLPYHESDHVPGDFWMTGMRDHQPDPLPFGPPRLQWSFNHDGEDLPGMVDDGDTRMNLNTTKARKDRQDMVSLAFFSAPRIRV